MVKTSKKKNVPKLDAAIEFALLGLEQRPEKAARTLYLTIDVYKEFEQKCSRMDLKPSQVLDALIAAFVKKS